MPQRNIKVLANAAKVAAVGHDAVHPVHQAPGHEHPAHAVLRDPSLDADVVLPAGADLGAAVARVESPAAELPYHDGRLGPQGEHLAQDRLAVVHDGGGGLEPRGVKSVF